MLYNYLVLIAIIEKMDGDILKYRRSNSKLY